MTEGRKYRKLSHEILGLIGLCAGISLALFLLLSGIATAIAESYVFQHDIPMTEFVWIDVDRWIFGVSALLSCCSFSVLFLVLLGDRIAYIRKITAGIDALRDPAAGVTLSLEGNNELTALAQAVNDMSDVQQQLRKKEQAQQKNYLQLIRSKAEQIRDLTAVLLDGTRRNPEQFDNGKLLLEQIAAEFEEELEAQFSINVNFDRCPAFSARLDVQELHRIFYNLASNIRKYADSDKPVTLTIAFENGRLLIRQRNSVLSKKEKRESYRIGLNSIRRIAQMYGGSVTVEENKEQFCISILLCDL